jgi:hypothetical protein
VDVVISLEHDLETTLLILQSTILVFIEVTDTDKFLVSIEFDRDILSAESGFRLNRVSLGRLKMTASFELDPDFSWLIDCQVQLQGLNCNLIVGQSRIHARKLLLNEIHFS